MSWLRLVDLRVNLTAMRLQVNVELRRQTTALFGPSGAGKTTLLEVIAGLRHPAAGQVWIGDQRVTDCGARLIVPPEQRRVGYVPQDLALFPHKTVRENLLYGARSENSQSKLFAHVVEVLGIGALLERSPGTVSGGEMQRVAVGRALMAGPRLLLLDEPLANLDLELKSKLIELFRAITREFQIPLIYVTHDATEIADFCEEVILLEAGLVVAQGAFEDLFSPGPPRYLRRVSA